MQRDNDRAVRERRLPFPISLSGYIVAKLGAAQLSVFFQYTESTGCESRDRGLERNMLNSKRLFRQLRA